MARSIMFGIFRLELEERRLLREGEELPLSPKVFDTLALLVEKPGHLVTKDEFMNRLWPNTFVGEDALAQNISLLRRVLSAGGNGQANAQEFIATVPKRGYRFVAPVKLESSGGTVSATVLPEAVGLPEGHVSSNLDGFSLLQTALPSAPGSSSASNKPQFRVSVLMVVCAGVFVGLLAGAAMFVALSPPRMPAVMSVTQITHSGRIDPGGKMISDGSRLYFQEREGDHWNVVQTSLTGGETQPVQVPFKNAVLLDLSPDHANFLMTFRTDGEMPLWAWPVQGGVPSRMGDLTAFDAVWHPNGRQVVFAKADGVYLADRDGAHVRQFASTRGSPWGLAWSPDGTVLRFAVFPSGTFSSSMWEIRSDGSNLRELFRDWNTPPHECCGSWSQDGTYFFFSSVRPEAGRRSNALWSIQEKTSWWRKSSAQPFRLTTGPTEFGGPLISTPDSRRLYVFGVDYRAELVSFDPKSRQATILLPGSRAEQADYSRDGEWLVYATTLDNVVWRAKSDGSLRTPVTAPPILATHPVWSPDAKRIAFVNHSPDCENKLYIVSADAGTPRELFPNECEQYDPAWSPDGKYLGFVRSEKLVSGTLSPSAIELLDLATNQRSTLADSQGLRSPSWSPDGQFVAAITEDLHKLLLFDVRSQKWAELAQGTSIGGFLCWSRDGAYLYFQDLLAPNEAVYRIRIRDRKLEVVASFESLIKSGVQRCAFMELAPDGSLVVTLLRNHADIYALSLQLP